MQIYTKWKRPERIKEKNTGKYLVEIGGYEPPKIKIENMINAGIRLKNTRKEQFDFASNDNVDESFIDPTRHKDYDIADAFQDSLEVKERLDANKNMEVNSENGEGTLQSDTNTNVSDDNSNDVEDDKPLEK